MKGSRNSVKKKTFFVVIFFIITLYILTGCNVNGSQNNSSNQKRENATTAKDNNSLVIALSPGSEPKDGFDPTTGWGRYGVQLFQSALMKRGKDSSPEVDLATEYTVSKDRLQWTFQLREDVIFSDGKPLTAEDVVFTFE